MSSYTKPLVNADGSIDIVFGPEEPKAKGNWIKTVPVKAGFRSFASMVPRTVLRQDVEIGRHRSCEVTSAYPARTLPAFTEQLMPLTVTDFTSTYLWMMGLSAMLVFPALKGDGTSRCATYEIRVKLYHGPVGSSFGFADQCHGLTTKENRTLWIGSATFARCSFERYRSLRGLNWFGG